MLSTSSVFAQLVYDSETWTYTNNGEIIEQDDIWIPVEDDILFINEDDMEEEGQEEGEAETMVEEDSQVQEDADQEIILSDDDLELFEPVTDDDLTILGSNNTSTDFTITADGEVVFTLIDEEALANLDDFTIQETQNQEAAELESEEEQLEAETLVENVALIVFDENEPIITVAEQSSPMASDVSVDDLSGMLGDARTALKAYLDQNASGLASVYNDNISARYWSSFADIISCVADDNAVVQIQKEIQNIVSTLDTRIKADSAWIFSQIATLEYQNELGLVNDNALAIETRVIATNIDAFNQNFISLIDFYTQGATESIIDFIATEEADEYEALLASYLERKTSIDQLKQAFAAFEKGSFFGQTVVGPRADELKEFAKEIFAIFENDTSGQWADRDPKAYQALLTQMRTAFDGKVDDTIKGLFPFWNIEWIYNSYSTLSDIYGIQKEKYNCQAVISNDTIDTAWPTLIDSIDAAQRQIAVAMSATGGAKSFEELKSWLSWVLLEYYQSDLIPLSQVAYENAEEIVLTQDQRLTRLYVSQVTSFLLNMRLEYLADDNITAFDAKLQRAITRINGAIDDGAEGRLLLILQSIRTSAVDVLG